jgi:uncharacterized RDD family membrane protein YckC
MKPVMEQAEHAGFVSRACAFVVDAVTIMVLLLALDALAHALLGFFTFNRAFVRAVEGDALLQAAYAILRDCVAVAVVLGYPIFFWMVTGQTPGKALLGLRVVRLDQKKVTFGCAARRCFGYWLSAVPLLLGFVWILADERRQGWHDKLAGTCVVYANRSKTIASPSPPAHPAPPAPRR